MISALGTLLSRLVGRLLPDPFVIAVLLGLLTLALALAVGDFGGRALTLPGKAGVLLDAFRSGEGLWKFLGFSMQMCLVLVTGHALAASRPVRAALGAVAGLPRSTAQGAALVAGVGCCCSVLNWGFGLIAGALVAREVGRAMDRRGVRAHYPLLVAAGFTGFMVWHGGLSGSAPLTMTTGAGMAILPPATREALAAAGYAGGIPLSATVFSRLNLVTTGGLMLLVPLACALLAPGAGRAGEVRTIREMAPRVADEPDISAGEEASGGRSVADRLDSSRVVVLLLAAALLAACWRFAATESVMRAGLNEINLVMLALGLILHGSARSYVAAVEDGARGCAGIILQFPLYGAILALLTASGLDRQIAGSVVRHAGPDSLPVLTFLAAGVLNMFIPSGGGQWGVQGPIAIRSALELGVEPGTMVMAVAYGDQVTNMLQVFWALPLLAITGVRARDIVGYTALVMVVGGAWVCLTLWVL